MDPQGEHRVARVVALPVDVAVERVEPPDLGARRGGRPVDDPQVAPQRAVEPAPRVGAEVGVLVDAGRHARIGELEEERARPGPEQQHRLAVQAPRLRLGPEHAGIGVVRIHAGTIAREPWTRGGSGWCASGP